MTKRAYNVVTEFGTFTRTSAREYKYLVISRGCTLKTLLKTHAAEVAETKRAYEKYNAVVTSGVVPAEYSSWATIEWYAKTAAEMAAKLVELETEPAPVEKTTFSSHQWSSRLDLAVREANSLKNGKSINGYRFADVKVIDVETGKEVA